MGPGTLLLDTYKSINCISPHACLIVGVVATALYTRAPWPLEVPEAYLVIIYVCELPYDFRSSKHIPCSQLLGNKCTGPDDPAL